ncbi:hypothetical protein [Kitasatospora sp. NPDC091207]|uniref:hypothetical protein n=1 Tax=Kitasatospora sp. NPDC091207 TaxID=3364083 RepID=UPI003822C6D2
MKKQTTTTPETALDALLLRRHGTVAVPGGAAPGEPDPWSWTKARPAAAAAAGSTRRPSGSGST